MFSQELRHSNNLFIFRYPYYKREAKVIAKILPGWRTSSNSEWHGYKYRANWECPESIIALYSRTHARMKIYTKYNREVKLLRSMCAIYLYFFYTVQRFLRVLVPSWACNLLTREENYIFLTFPSSLFVLYLPFYFADWKFLVLHNYFLHQWQHFALNAAVHVKRKACFLHLE